MLFETRYAGYVTRSGSGEPEPRFPQKRVLQTRSERGAESVATMAYPVPNSDDPALFRGIEDDSKRLQGWDLLVYKCKQQPLVPLGTPSTFIEVIDDIRRSSNMSCPLRGCEHGIQKELQRNAILLPSSCSCPSIHSPRSLGRNLRLRRRQKSQQLESSRKSRSRRQSKTRTSHLAIVKLSLGCLACCVGCCE